MTRLYKFEGSQARLEKKDKGFSASCQCGWQSKPMESKEEAVIAFENHVMSDPSHKIIEESKKRSISSLLVAAVGILYIISPVDLVPDTLVLVGWIEDIIIGIISIIFIKKGLDGESPGRILSETF